MVKRNAIATKLTKICTQTQKRSFDVAEYDARSKFSQVLFYDQVDIMGYPTEPYYPYPYYPTDALLSLFLLSY